MSVNFRVDLVVKPKPGVRDPQGDAVGEALRGLGYTDFRVDYVGRALRLHVQAADEGAARQMVERMCDQLLVNPNIETYALEVHEAT